jgi:hypothetical protein
MIKRCMWLVTLSGSGHIFRWPEGNWTYSTSLVNYRDSESDSRAIHSYSIGTVSSLEDNESSQAHRMLVSGVGLSSAMLVLSPIQAE